tara:strand:- start:3499 stop:3642 length:144 start_codon:yes stop_codon:yes gene_type:complete
MPFSIKKVKGGYKLYNTDKKVFVNVLYKSRDSAKNAGNNFMRYAYRR